MSRGRGGRWAQEACLIHAVSATTVDLHGDTVGPLTFCFVAEGGASYLLQFAGETANEVETPPLLPGERCVPPGRPRPALRAAAPAEGNALAAPEEEMQSIPEISPRPDESLGGFGEAWPSSSPSATARRAIRPTARRSTPTAAA
jgi:hypothetical protein